jgi:hypothetical protein
MVSRRAFILSIIWIASSNSFVVSTKVNSVVVAVGVALMLVGDAVVGVASDVAAIS